MYMFILLVLLPLFLAIGLWWIPFRFLQLTILLFSFVLSFCSILLYISPETFSFSLGFFLTILIIVVDIVLILYFLKEGLAFKNYKVWSLALAQLLLFGLAEFLIASNVNADFIVDKLSIFMFLVINIVGSLIVVYALWYINKEPISESKKRFFLMYLILFLAVMNLIVSANSLMIFFLLFELTTLSSYLLIGFRKDELSTHNALKALWMNQIGGLFILIAVLLSSVPYFDGLTNSGNLLIVVSLLAMSGLVKGAQIPFDGWLLGAMVAPSPVSAILHSATMVKLAPFIILKLAPAYENTIVGVFIMLFGSAVFILAGLYGLSRDKFKEILGYSTISLLGLMIAMATVVGEEHKNILYVLIFFHAVSKALLFLMAGIVEKNYHFKNISEMNGLLFKAPLSASMIIFGFATITLPPFGLFFGKLFSIELVSQMLKDNFLYIFLLLSLCVGSVVLILLYFKVASSIFTKNTDIEEYNGENIFVVEMISPYLFTIMLVCSGFFLFDISLYYVIISILLIVFVPVWLKFDPFRNVDRVKEYHCGEQGHFNVSQWSFSFSKETERKVSFIGAAAFASIALGGLL